MLWSTTVREDRTLRAGPSSGSARRHRPIALSALGIIVGLLLSWAGVAAAQETGTIQGTLFYQDAEGERVPAEGVRIVVADADGADAGEGVTDAEGFFAVELPAPADYQVSIDTESIPAGLSLRDPTKTSLPPFTLNGGQERNVLFPLVEGEGGVDTSAPAGDGFGTKLARLTFDGLVFGLIIAMSSIGLSLIFGTTGLTNFAHGELVTLGALLALLFNVGVGLHVLLAAPIAIALTAGAGFANERLVWRPLRRRGTGLIAMLVISIGLSIVARYVFLYYKGGDTDFLQQYSQQSPYVVGPLNIVPRKLWIIAISVVTLVAVAIGVQTTKLGKAMRAVADNKDLAESSGIDVERVILSIWVIGGGLAGLGGVLFGLNQGIAWDMGFELLLLMFAAVTLGGLGTAYGPLLGSLIVGMFVNLSTLVVAPELKNVGTLLVLVVILLVRPQGLLGRKERIG